MAKSIPQINLSKEEANPGGFTADLFAARQPKTSDMKAKTQNLNSKHREYQNLPTWEATLFIARYWGLAGRHAHRRSVKFGKQGC
jgi:hypothetical protein